MGEVRGVKEGLIQGLCNSDSSQKHMNKLYTVISEAFYRSRIYRQQEMLQNAPESSLNQKFPNRQCFENSSTATQCTVNRRVGVDRSRLVLQNAKKNESNPSGNGARMEGESVDEQCMINSHCPPNQLAQKSFFHIYLTCSSTDYPHIFCILQLETSFLVGTIKVIIKITFIANLIATWGHFCSLEVKLITNCIYGTIFIRKTSDLSLVSLSLESASLTSSLRVSVFGTSLGHLCLW